MILNMALTFTGELTITSNRKDKHAIVHVPWESLGSLSTLLMDGFNPFSPGFASFHADSSDPCTIERKARRISVTSKVQADVHDTQAAAAEGLYLCVWILCTKSKDTCSPM